MLRTLTCQQVSKTFRSLQMLKAAPSARKTSPEKKAKAAIVTQALIRYFATAGLLYLILISGFANPLAAFSGIMGLKIGAYLQPSIHRFTIRKYPDPEPPPGIPDEEEEVVK